MINIFTINKQVELTSELLYKMMNEFIVSVQPKLQKYKNYYDGIQAIQNKTYSDETKPCSRTVTNMCKNIVDSYCGYVASPGFISYNSEQDFDEIMQILSYNDYQNEDSDFLLNALVYGVSAELMYNDEQGQVRFKLINPLSCFGVWDDSLTNDLLYFVRFYKKNNWDDSLTYVIDVYSGWDIKHYEMAGLNGGITFINSEQHYFNQCPANVFMLPDEKSIFDCITSLQDNYNDILGNFSDDISCFTDAMLKITGDFDSNDLNIDRESRVLVLPSNNSGTIDAEWMTKDISKNSTETMLKRLQDSIYKIAACPDFSSDTFVGGVSSGIALRFRLCGMETRAAKICAAMQVALRRRIEIICGIVSLKLGENVWKDCDIVFKRNVPIDNTEIINLVNSLQGIVSRKTLLSQINFITDVDKEAEAVAKEKQENMDMFGFTDNHTHAEDEEDE